MEKAEQIAATIVVKKAKKWLNQNYPKHLFIEMRSNHGKELVRELWEAIERYERIKKKSRVDKQNQI